MGLRVGCGVGVDGCLPLILVSVVISVTCWLWLVAIAAWFGFLHC